VTLNEYQEKALATASDGGSELIQRVLGLAGESGEIADKIKRWLRDHDGDLASLDRKILAAELGDTLWYVAALADFLGYRLDDVAQDNIARRADRQKRRAPGGGG
jgi:NTP pyrophosphatase (non-canonical NTP hydrolase)